MGHAQVGHLNMMLRGFDNNLMGTDPVHQVVETFGPIVEFPLNVQHR